MFEGLRKYQEIVRNKRMVEPFKHLDWTALAVPVTDMRLLQSFKDRVRNGARMFPVGFDKQILPILEKVGVRVSFSESYHRGFAESPLSEGSKLEISDLCSPIAVELDIDPDNYLKLTNIHFGTIQRS